MPVKVRRKKAGKAAQSRIGAKIKHLVDTGEVPNTPVGRKRAAGMAYGMEKAGRLRAGGAYVPVKRRKRHG